MLTDNKPTRQPTRARNSPPSSAGGGANGIERPTTDLGNAERLVDKFGDRIRYVAAWKKWLVWDGARWAIDEMGEVHRFAKRTVRAILREAAATEDQNRREDLAKWARSSENHNRIDAMIALAVSEPLVAVNYRSLDSDGWLFNCANGTLDLRTGWLRPHDPGDLITKSTGVEYPSSEGIEAPLWQKFLETIFDGDRELIGFVQRVFGAALIGEQLEHLLLVLHGSGANGKSVLIALMIEAMGDYAIAAPPGLLMAQRGERHPTELADLFGRRLVVVSETRDGQRLDEGLVKATTGGDVIKGRRMREDFWSFTPSHMPVIITNHKPVIRGDDFGIWRRLRLIPFAVTIPPKQQDRQLAEKLRTELPAILHWLVQGCLEWQSDGLKEPSAVLAAIAEYRRDSDTIARWIDDETIEDRDADTKASDLRASYERWCEDAGERPIGPRKFGERLAARFDKNKRRDGIFYEGIRLCAANV